MLSDPNCPDCIQHRDAAVQPPLIVVGADGDAVFLGTCEGTRSRGRHRRKLHCDRRRRRWWRRSPSISAGITATNTSECLTATASSAVTQVAASRVGTPNCPLLSTKPGQVPKQLLTNVGNNKQARMAAVPQRTNLDHPFPGPVKLVSRSMDVLQSR
jgi:hypothetical protein